MRLVLLGGGHSHLAVLDRLAGVDPAALEVTLVSPGRWQYYSGMMPGWIAGIYRENEIRIDLERLAAAAGVRFVRGRAVGIDVGQRLVLLADGSRLDYDLLSIDIGSQTRCEALDGCGDRLVAIKPLETFPERWQAALAADGEGAGRAVAVVGGGAAGFELALAVARAPALAAGEARVHLVTGAGGLLPAQTERVRRLASRALRQAGVTLHEEHADGADGGLQLQSGHLLPAAVVLAATGAAAPDFLRQSELALDEQGFIRVDATHRSISHADVFAAGDVCARDDPSFQRSGVHAVHAGPVLFHNLLATATGSGLRPYRPRKAVLYLLSCANGSAIATWGRFSFSGRLAWWWKNWIDHRFVSRYRR